MARNDFTIGSFALRFGFSLALVFLTYNPGGYSWVGWLTSETPLVYKVATGVVLLIGWVIYLRATLRSLGEIGTILAVLFFAALTWVMIDYGLLSVESPTVFTWVILTMLAAIMATGMSWSHIRRRMSGQLDVDDVEQE